MKKTAFCLAAIVLAAAPAACSDDDHGPGPTDAGPDAQDGWRCPLDTMQRWLLEDALEKTWNDLEDTAQDASEGRYGIRFRIAGNTAASASSVTLTSGCPGPQELNVNCRSDNDPNPTDPFYVDHDLCQQIVCEEADLMTLRVFFTMRPHRDFADTHAFTCAGNIMYGDTFVWDPNPRVVWRYDERTAGQMAIEATIDRQITVEIDQQDPVDLSHQGTVAAAVAGGTVESATLSLSFTGIASGGVDASVTRNAQGDGEGQVTYDSHLIATFDAMGVQWSENCQWME